jgi:hypothetical protein
VIGNLSTERHAGLRLEHRCETILEQLQKNSSPTGIGLEFTCGTIRISELEQVQYNCQNQENNCEDHGDTNQPTLHATATKEIAPGTAHAAGQTALFGFLNQHEVNHANAGEGEQDQYEVKHFLSDARANTSRLI